MGGGCRRILVELAGFDIELTAGHAAVPAASGEAAQALESLGFKKEEVARALAKCESTETSALVKEALKLLQKL